MANGYAAFNKHQVLITTSDMENSDGSLGEKTDDYPEEEFENLANNEEAVTGVCTNDNGVEYPEEGQQNLIMKIRARIGYSNTVTVTSQ